MSAAGFVDAGGMQSFDLICIGCGPAGERAATYAAQLGKRVAIVERCVRPGGAMVNTGTLPSKALRETALICSMFHRRPIPGMELRFDHGLSVRRFMAQRHRLEMEEHDRIEGLIDHHDITILRGHGRIAGPNHVDVAPEFEETVRYGAEYILICTGSRPVRPDHIPFDDKVIVDADSVLNLDMLPRRMVIVGGGVIGCEYASIFAEIDVQVDLINARDAILPWLDPECCEHLVRSMQRNGVRFRYNESVTGAEVNDANEVTVTLESGETITADVMLWAAGRQSNTDDIGMDTINVDLDTRGLVNVDKQYRTTEPTVFAAGDVIGFPALAATSMEQGLIAVTNMFNEPYREELADMMPIGIYTIPAISCIGMTAEEAAKEGLDVISASAGFRTNARGRMLGDDAGILKCVFERSTGRLVGCTVVGEQATELIHVAQLAIVARVGIEYFVNVCFNYPSLTSLYKDAASQAMLAMQHGMARAA
jgi:NAD(P) transhydrogenase